MKNVRQKLISVLCGSVLAASLAAPVAAADTGACSVARAKRAYAAASRAVVRAKARKREACHVLSATRRYSGMYGASVGRWTRLARRSGYQWYEFGTLMRVIDRESNGCPTIPNAEGSGALGLLQVMPEWADGSKVDFWGTWDLPAKWDRTNPRQTLRHCVHMAWSNWGE